MLLTLIFVFTQIGVAFSAQDSVREDAGFVEGDVRSYEREPDAETFLPVKDRSFPEFVAKGLTFGKLTVLPSVSVETSYNDNLFATNSGEVSDVKIMTTPKLSGHTDDEGNFFRFDVSANIARYLENSSENYQEFDGNASGYFKLKNSLLLPWSGGVKRVRQDREDNLSRVFTREPLNISEARFDGGVRYRPNRVGFTVLGRHVRRTFEDGVSLLDPTVNIVRSDGDFKTNEIELETEYEFKANHVGFLKGIIGKTKYDDPIFNDSTGTFTNIRRDSDNILALFGLRTEYKGLVQSDIGIGYTSIDFEDNSLSDVENIAVEASVDWNVTKLSSLGLDLTRSIIQDNEVIQGVVQTYGKLSLDHELRRSLILQAYGAYINRDFDNVAREDDVYRLGLGFLYRPSPYYDLGGEYIYNKQESDTRGNEFDSNLFLLRLTGKY